MYQLSLPSLGSTSNRPSTNMAQLSLAYLPHPGNPMTSSYVSGGLRNQACANLGIMMARLRHSPSGLRASCRSSGATLDRATASGSSRLIHLNTDSAASQCVRLTSWHATIIQNGLFRRSSWNSLPLGGACASLIGLTPVFEPELSGRHSAYVPPLAVGAFVGHPAGSTAGS